MGRKFLLLPLLPFLLFSFLPITVFSQEAKRDELRWDNPVTAEYLKKNLPKKFPKLILTPTLAGQVKSLQRRFVKESDNSVLVEDTFETSDSTRYLTWAIMTTAEVIPVENGAVLQQDGKELKLSILAPAGLNVSILSLDPPPLEIDKTIPGLKRIEIRVPAYLAKNGHGKIQVRLSDR